jgi:hypothetical protein
MIENIVLLFLLCDSDESKSKNKTWNAQANNCVAIDKIYRKDKQMQVEICGYEWDSCSLVRIEQVGGIRVFAA